MHVSLLHVHVSAGSDQFLSALGSIAIKLNLKTNLAYLTNDTRRQLTTEHYFQLFGKVSSKNLFDSTYISRCNPALLQRYRTVH